jgi:hypothetical protein
MSNARWPSVDTPTLDALSWGVVAVCLFAFAAWLVLLDRKTQHDPGTVEIVGRLEHAADWRQGRRSSAVTVLQVSGSAVRVTTKRVSSSTLMDRMASSPVSVRALVKASPELHGRDPIVPARALWIDGVAVLTPEETADADASASGAARLLVMFVALGGLYALFKAYALRRERVEA